MTPLSPTPATGFPLTGKQREHLDHMTDGRWHDSCPMCLHRRVRSGTGIPEYDAYLRSQHPELAPERLARDDRKD